jgi:cytoskeletal protein CcmA (bactofilin family)
MFETLRGVETKEHNHSGRSHFGETMQLEGDIRSAGAVDIAGLINGNVFVAEVCIVDSGSVRGIIEAETIEINGHVEGKISANSIIVGKSAVIKGDIFFKNTLKTEEGADIDGYIKRTSTGKENTDEDITIEEIVEKEKSSNPKIIPVTHHKEAV